MRKLVNMEEREALKRQIQLLETLINKHKSVHGDDSFTGVVQRQPQGPGTSVHPSHSYHGTPYAPQSQGSWRKMYSLRNKNPQSSAGHPSLSASSSVHQSASLTRPTSVSLPGQSRGNETDLSRTSTLSSGDEARQEKAGHSSTAVVEKQSSGAADACLQPEAADRQAEEASRHVLLPEKTLKGSLAASQSSFQRKSKISLTSRTSGNTSQTITGPSTAVLPSRTTTANPSGFSQHPLKVSSYKGDASVLKKSKFTWVKSQNEGREEPKQLNSAFSATTGSTSSAPLSKKTPFKKLPRKFSPVSIAPKTTKYKWVSSGGAQARTSRKPLSPAFPQKTMEKTDSVRKLKLASPPSAKLKKGVAGSCSDSSLSRYRWKAEGQSTSAAATRPSAAATGPSAAATRPSASTLRRSAFNWAAENNPRGGFPSSSHAGFKLRSRMKIIRSGGMAEKGSSPPAGRCSPRSRMLTATRRTPGRELVSFGKHKLRRLSPTLPRTNPISPYHRSPASQRVFRTRYKIVTRPGTAATHTTHYNPALSWRAKRIQSARSFLQNRLRAPHERHPFSTQCWTGSGMCWIRGSLYRVSANKLSRTVTASMSINRTGRYSGAHTSHMTPTSARPSTTRHLASRAVQRSIAIIRQARQKKQQKQYCMYYNRFGKCNRGTSCPFIHDPDKVAVCTRFLRGTCKQADGECPFSHKVAKEKMPVCSYFLRGICNNSDCPYSHVYVSRKAEVCEDFVRGYCPEGEKCKKKHTLVCPDFSRTGSCLRGIRCKLQHRQRVKQSVSGTSVPPAKKTRSKEPPKRPRLSVVMPKDSPAAPGMPTKGPLSLPSFISLSSSPEEADAPDTLPADTTQVREKKLQIKPRL